ncbi:MAG TPA: arginase family protein [Gemmatimonadales bacterium]
MRFKAWLVIGLAVPVFGTAQQRVTDETGTGRVSFVLMPYTGARNVPERSPIPAYLIQGGIEDALTRSGVSLAPTTEIRLTGAEEREYGEWHRMGLANAHLGRLVAQNLARGDLSIGLLANCTSLLGMLGGLQQGAAAGLRRVGLVFIDAHGDFNTPETTLSGMLGGMPVAVAAGLGLTNLRRESGLIEPIPAEHIIIAAARDLDPLERELLNRSNVRMLSTDDIRQRSEQLHAEIQRLSELTDVIYVHVDMDVLDPREVPGHPLTVPDGPTSTELAAALIEVFRYPKAVAFGVASTPANERDPDGVSRRAAYNLIGAVVRGWAFGAQE